MHESDERLAADDWICWGRGGVDAAQMQPEHGCWQLSSRRRTNAGVLPVAGSSYNSNQKVLTESWLSCAGAVRWQLFLRRERSLRRGKLFSSAEEKGSLSVIRRRKRRAVPFLCSTFCCVQFIYLWSHSSIMNVHCKYMKSEQRSRFARWNSVEQIISWHCWEPDGKSSHLVMLVA